MQKCKITTLDTHQSTCKIRSQWGRTERIMIADQRFVVIINVCDTTNHRSVIIILSVRPHSLLILQLLQQHVCHMSQRRAILLQGKNAICCCTRCISQSRLLTPKLIRVVIFHGKHKGEPQSHFLFKNSGIFVFFKP